MKKFLILTVLSAMLLGGLPSTSEAIAIQLPRTKVIWPSDGEIWYTGQTNKIVWDTSSTGNSTSVNITLNNASCLNTYCIALAPYQIATEAKNNGVYEWSIPKGLNSFFTGRQYIRISPNYSDSFNSPVFTVADPDAVKETKELNISTTSDLTAVLGETFTATFTGSGGTTPYTWSLSGNVPKGFELKPAPVPLYCKLPDCNNGNPIGIALVGTPQEVGPFQIKMTIKDSNGWFITRDFMLSLRARSPGEPTRGSGASQTGQGVPTRVVKIEGDSTVYLMTPKGKLVPLPSQAALNSNGFNFSDIKVLKPYELNKTGSLYVRLGGGGRIYKLEDGKRRPISSPAWTNLGAPVEDIVDLNSTTFFSYTLGTYIY